MRKKIYIILTILLVSFKSFSQLVVTNDTTISSCTPVCKWLKAKVTPKVQFTTYKIDSAIPFTTDPFNGGTMIPNTSFAGVKSKNPSDRGATDLIPIGFNFCFWGLPYSKFKAATNGWIGFSPRDSVQDTSEFAMGYPIPSIAPKVPKNAIMASWEDFQVGNNVYYNLLGTAPNRRLVVSYNNLLGPASFYVFCNGAMGICRSSFQIVIYESTNIIDIYIKKKPSAKNNTFLTGVAHGVMGLHNINGTQAIPVPGKNATQWPIPVTTDLIDYPMRFIPQGSVATYATKWYDSTGTTVISSIDSVNVCPIKSSYYIVKVIRQGCPIDTLIDTVRITINKPTCAIAGPDRTICRGDTAYLWAKGGVSYSWLPSGSLSNANIYNPIASPTVTTTYIVTVKDAGGSVLGTDDQIIFVNPLPTTNAGTDKTICLNQTTANLTASGGGTYAWNPANLGLSAYNISNPVANPSASTTYTLTVTLNGCTGTDNVFVTVIPPPTADAGLGQTICSGGQATLTATGGGNYAWDKGAGNTAVVKVNPNSNTTYTVTVTNTNGCTASDFTTVTVQNSFTISVNNATICAGQNATLTANGGNAWTWAPGSQTTQSITISPLTTTTYSVSATSGTCSATGQGVVTVNPVPVANADTDKSICPNQTTATLNASGGGTYAWSPAAGLSAVNISNPIANPANTTTYNLVVSSNGCTSSDNVVVTVNSIPIVTAGQPLSICNNTTPVSFTATGADSYLWNNGTNNAILTITPSAQNNTYIVVGTSNGCTASASVTAVVLAPSVDAGIDQTICAGQSAILNAISPNAITYAWSNGVNTTTNNVSPISTTVYYISASNSIPCTAVDSVTVVISPPPPVNFFADTLSGCEPFSVNFTDSTNIPNSTYFWRFRDYYSPNSDSTSQNPSHVFSKSGTYSITLKVITPQGCVASLTKNAYIKVYSNPTANFYALPVVGNTTEPIAFINQSQNGSNYQWYFGDTISKHSLNSSNLHSPTHVYDTTGTYTVTLITTSKDGCIDSTTNRVKIRQDWAIYIPNAFKPKGINQTFIAKRDNLDDSYYEMYIYDRWGINVFYSDSWTKGWDGLDFKGVEVPIDTYVYTIQVKEWTGKLHRYIGKVTILR